MVMGQMVNTNSSKGHPEKQDSPETKDPGGVSKAASWQNTKSEIRTKSAVWEKGPNVEFGLEACVIGLSLF